MRFSLFQLLLLITGVSVLCALLVNVPASRGVLAAFTFGGALSLLAAKAGDSHIGRWLHATLGAWLGLACFTFLGYADPSGIPFSELLEAIVATGVLACFVGTVVWAAVGSR